jgi:hypothetical protein
MTVLEEQDSQNETPVRRLELSPFPEESEDESRAAQSDEKAEEDRLRETVAERHRDRDGDGDRERSLQRASEEERSPDLLETLERELESDDEQQRHDAELGEHFDLFDVGDQPQTAWSDDQSGDQKADERGDFEPGADQDDRRRRSEQNHEVVEQGNVRRHAGSVAEGAASRGAGALLGAGSPGNQRARPPAPLLVAPETRGAGPPAPPRLLASTGSSRCEFREGCCRECRDSTRRLSR